ncbi:MAG: TolC family protein [Bacteriovoracaceae bacterium]|jgi:outer membrane protein TolC|nr:TolC family protein [Bacteriovoracaceae bacterium]
MIKLFVVIFLSGCFETKAMTFAQAIKVLHSHESVDSVRLKSKALDKEAESRGSWGDPKFKIAAKNFPKDSLKDDQTPMSGIEMGVSQKIALTTKYGNLESSFKSLANAYDFEADDQKEALAKAFWEVLILRRKISQELAIFKENERWILKILKVSKRLYSTGKTSQQALLDIQIRKSEIESELNNKRFELSQLNDRLDYLIGSSELKMNSIPWQLLRSDSKKRKDHKELSLKEKIKAKELSLTASRQNYIPDVTVSIGYTKRANIDENGDFVGAAISFPLPLSAEKYSKHAQATQEKYRAVKNYENYIKGKKRDTSVLSKEIDKLSTELNILEKKTIKFARNSREITAKSYGLGNSTYVELLQSELKLQKILMQKVLLEAKRDMKRVALKYVKGEALYE